MNPRHIKITLVSALMFTLALAVCGAQAPTAPAATAPESTPEKTFGAPEDLEAILLVNEEIKKVDQPYKVTLIINNPTRWPIRCDESFDLVAGFDAKKMELEKGEGGKTVVKHVEVEGFVRRERSVRKLDRPLVIAPGAFVGREIDLSYHFPALRRAGRYVVKWDDPLVGRSNEVVFSVAEYVLLATNYGNIGMRLLPDVSPKTAAEFKRRVRERKYDGSVVVGADGQRIQFNTLNPGDRFPAEEESLMPEPSLRARSVALVEGGPGFFIQTFPVSEKVSKGFTIFAEIFDGLDAAYALANARQARDIHGNPRYSPEDAIRVERAVLVDSCPEIYPFAPSEKVTDTAPRNFAVAATRDKLLRLWRADAGAAQDRQRHRLGHRTARRARTAGGAAGPAPKPTGWSPSPAARNSGSRCASRWSSDGTWCRCRCR